jgi:hypothetical protein
MPIMVSQLELFGRPQLKDAARSAAALAPAADWLVRHDVGSLKGPQLQTARDTAQGRLLQLCNRLGPVPSPHQVSSAFFSCIIHEMDRSGTLMEMLIRLDGDGSVELDALFRRLREDDSVQCSCGLHDCRRHRLTSLSHNLEDEMIIATINEHK